MDSESSDSDSGSDVSDAGSSDASDLEDAIDDDEDTPHADRKFISLEPCSILFTQNHISYKFQNGKTIEESACEVAGELLKKRDIMMM